MQTEHEATFRPVIEIDDLPHAASGRQRDIYVLAEAAIPKAWRSSAKAPVMVLKVPRYAKRRARQGRLKALFHRLFPALEQRVITSEAAYLSKLLRRARDDPGALPFPEFMGFVETNRGTGALWEAIRGGEGELAPTLAEICRRGEIERVLEPLNAFTETCFTQSIVMGDVNYHNLLVEFQADPPRIRMVDGFGDHRMVSIRAFWRAYNARRLVEGFEKIARQTGLHFDAQTQRFRLK